MLRWLRFTQRSKHFRFRGKWEEIGLGHANLLLCRVSGKLRFLMTTAEKTAQLVGNIEVVDGTLTSNDQSDCAWVWRAEPASPGRYVNTGHHPERLV